MVRFDWKIESMRDAVGTVIQVWFVVTARDTETGREQGLHASVTLPEPQDGEAFTEYAELTEKQVIEWVKAHPAAEGFKERAREALEQTALDDEQIPAGLPWASGADGGNA